MVFGPIKPINHWLFQVGNILSIISYVQIDIMYLRIIMMITDLIFVCYGIFIINIGVDAVIWNLLQAIINIILLIPIIKQRLPIKFAKHELELYRTVERFLTPFQFNLLIENGEMRTYREAGTQICLEGNSCVLYKEGHKMASVSEGTWIGHAEYLNHLGIIDFEHIQDNMSYHSTTERHKKMTVISKSKPKSFKLSKASWGITCQVENALSEAIDVNLKEDVPDSSSSNVSYEPEDDDEEYDKDTILVFKWDFKRMNSLFENPEHGRSFKNAIFSLWLKSVSDYILRQGKEIYEVKVKNEEIEKESIRRNTILLDNPIIEEEFLKELQDCDSDSESKGLSSDDSNEISQIGNQKDEKYFNQSVKVIPIAKAKSKVDKNLMKKTNLRNAYATKSKEVKSTECEIKNTTSAANLTMDIARMSSPVNPHKTNLVAEKAKQNRLAEINEKRRGSHLAKTRISHPWKSP